MYAFIHVLLHISMHVYMHSDICMCVCMFNNICMCLGILFNDMYMLNDICMCLYMCFYMFNDICMHLCNNLILGVLTPLSTIFQLYHGDQFYHLRLQVECTLFCNLQSRARTHAVLVIVLYELLDAMT
jgi:hypothetical protein